MKLIIRILAVLLIASPAQATWTVFDGANDYLAITQFAAINTDVFSVGCTVTRTSDGEGGTGRIMDKADGGSEAGFALRTNNDDTLIRFAAFRAGVNDGVWTIALPANPFQITVTYDGTDASNNPVIYVNGSSVSVTEITTPLAAMVVGAENLLIGNITAQTRTWDGYLGDCFFFGRILSASQVLQISQYGPMFVSGGRPVCYWPMGSFAGENFGGSSGASCAASVAGTPTNDSTGPKRSSAQGGFLRLGH